MSRHVFLPPDEPASDQGIKAGGWWSESEDGTRVLCGVCPRACSLGPGDRGFCFVRQNLDGRMVSTTYGRSTGFCIDPIEKKPLNHFYPGSATLSFGTAGCNLGCKYCQNWSMSRSHDVDAACQVADPQTIARAARELGCRSVSFTYNDPIIWAEYAIDTARACHAAGIQTVAVTSGYIASAAREAFYEHMDAANVDLKGFSDDFYRRLCGGRLEPVLETLQWLAHQRNVWLEITNLIIPGANDSPQEIQRMCEWIVAELGPDVPLHFSAFHPDFKLTDRGPTSPETLRVAHDTARQAGLRYVYTGNVSDRERQSTCCPGCGRKVIQRDGYLLGVFDVRGSCCHHCKTPIAGRFDDQPGNWGGRRTPVDIAAYARPKQPQATRAAASEVAAPQATERTAEPKIVVADRPGLTAEQEQTVFRAAAERVMATVQCRPFGAMRALLPDVASIPVYGVFVSLKRGCQLRSCCGFLGQSVALADAVEQAAIRAAKDDPRFPPISPTELGHLDMEVWLLWGLQAVTARGEDRVGAITIGRHGLQIVRGQARGLLLPGVAVEHRLDAAGFLKQVCLKAGLPPDAWRRDDATLMTFEGHAICGPFPTEGPVEESPAGGPRRSEVETLAEFCRGNIEALLHGATPMFYLPGGFDGSVAGLALAIVPPGEAKAVECSKLSMRPEMPLQSTLFSLAEASAWALQSQGRDVEWFRGARVALTVFWDPAMHGTAAQPELDGVEPRHRAVLVNGQGRMAWVFDPVKSSRELLAEAIARAGLTELVNANVLSLAAVSSESRAAMAQIPRPEVGPEVRAPGVAGMFYPDTLEEIRQAVEDLLPKARPEPRPYPAVMVPHAGWIYSGQLAAEVFSRVQIPDRVIVLCPKHRSGGAEWAVAPQRVWDLPGFSVPSDADLAARLARGISGLELDAAPHRQEHAIEVQLPIIHRLAPHARVIGITIGGGEIGSLKRFAEQMGAVLGAIQPRPLLVISSDMNHFADEAETRRLDWLALEAMESLDPERLYHTVRENRISMCGMFAAVIVMETLRQWGVLSRYELVGHTTSAQVSGDLKRVVGYAGVLLG